MVKGEGLISAHIVSVSSDIPQVPYMSSKTANDILSRNAAIAGK